MKSISVILGFLLIAVLLIPFSGNDQLFAISGCCKERKSIEHPWKESKKSFGDCKSINKQKDNDNVFKESGLVWWDRSC